MERVFLSKNANQTLVQSRLDPTGANATWRKATYGKLGMNLTDRAAFLDIGDAPTLHNKFNAEPRDVIGLQGKPFYAQRNAQWYQNKQWDLYVMRPITKNTPLIVTEASRSVNPIAGGNFFSDSLITRATGVNPTNYAIFGTDDIKDRLKAHNVSANNPLSPEFALRIGQSEQAGTAAIPQNTVMNSEEENMIRDQQFLIDQALAGREEALQELSVLTANGDQAFKRLLNKRRFTKRLVDNILSGQTAIRDKNNQWHAFSSEPQPKKKVEITSHETQQDATGGGNAMRTADTEVPVMKEAQPENNVDEMQSSESMMNTSGENLGSRIRDLFDGLSDHVSQTSSESSRIISFSEADLAGEDSALDQLESITPQNLRRTGDAQHGRGLAGGIPFPSNENKQNMIEIERIGGKQSGYTGYMNEISAITPLTEAGLSAASNIYNWSTDNLIYTLRQQRTPQNDISRENVSISVEENPFSVTNSRLVNNDAGTTPAAKRAFSSITPEEADAFFSGKKSGQYEEQEQQNMLDYQGEGDGEYGGLYSSYHDAEPVVINLGGGTAVQEAVLNGVHKALHILPLTKSNETSLTLALVAREFTDQIADKSSPRSYRVANMLSSGVIYPAFIQYAYPGQYTTSQCLDTQSRVNSVFREKYHYEEASVHEGLMSICQVVGALPVSSTEWNNNSNVQAQRSAEAAMQLVQVMSQRFQTLQSYDLPVLEGVTRSDEVLSALTVIATGLDILATVNQISAKDGNMYVRLRQDLLQATHIVMVYEGAMKEKGYSLAFTPSKALGAHTRNVKKRIKAGIIDTRPVSERAEEMREAPSLAKAFAGR